MLYFLSQWKYVATLLFESLQVIVIVFIYSVGYPFELLNLLTAYVLSVIAQVFNI